MYDYSQYDRDAPAVQKVNQERGKVIKQFAKWLYELTHGKSGVKIQGHNNTVIHDSVFQNIANQSKSDQLKVAEVLTSISDNSGSIQPIDTVLDNGKRILILDKDEKYVIGVHDVETGITRSVPSPGQAPYKP